MAEEKVCASCGLKTGTIKGSVSFRCPGCGEAEIVRCEKCRTVGRTYACPGCGFGGP